MNRIRLHIVSFFLLLSLSVWSQGRFQPGDVVPKPYLKVYGHEAFFTISQLDGKLVSWMWNKSLKTKEGISPESLRYVRVLHCDADGNAIVGELVCNAVIAKDLLDIFKTLYESAYPIERMRLVDCYGGDDEASMRDNNTSCFNQRPITAGGRISKHSYGLAVDINPKYNPYYKMKASGKALIRPEGSTEYLDRKEAFPYKIERGDLCYLLFRKHGFRWGGEWASGKDYQHFEK